tara:strand:- start:3294 stop:4211 length:918 start_codon:yes stop_codon:yes gene_type:complete
MNIFKNILLILIFFIILCSNSIAKNTKLIKENSYKNDIVWNGIKFNLPEGNWIFYDRYRWDFENWYSKCVSFISLKNKIIKGHYELCYITSGGKWKNYLGLFLLNNFRKDQYDNCTLRPEYFYAKLKYKGITFNCFVTRHIDPEKELYYPDDPEDKYAAKIKKYINDNELILPVTGLGRESFYFSNITDKGLGVSLFINPELYGAPKSLYGLEENSEYHRSNIDNYPIKKNFFMKWTKEMSYEHGYFEKQLKVKDHIKLDFSDIAISNQNETGDFIEQIKKLNNLFKSGVITKEEFKKAKKKILN